MCPRRRSRTHGGGRAGRALGRPADLSLRRISAGCRAQPSMRLTPSRQRRIDGMPARPCRLCGGRAPPRFSSYPLRLSGRGNHRDHVLDCPAAPDVIRPRAKQGSALLQCVRPTAGIAKTPVSHGVEPHDFETGPGPRSRPQPSRVCRRRSPPLPRERFRADSDQFVLQPQEAK
jgi:hypothetical protein